ncbi:MAG: hypothetical protein PVI71_14385 [Desulfobacterales bacterium]
MVLHFCFILACSLYPLEIIQEIGHGVFSLLRGDENPWEELDRASQAFVFISFFKDVKGLIVISFIITQLAILWCMTGYSKSKRVMKHIKKFISIFLLSGFFAALLCGGLLTFLEFINRLEEVDGRFPGGPARYYMYILMLVIWILLFILMWRICGKNELQSMLARALPFLFAASCVEYFVALPIDVLARTIKAYSWLTGTWMALYISFPLIFWTFGPVLYLIFNRNNNGR